MRHTLLEKNVRWVEPVLARALRGDRYFVVPASELGGLRPASFLTYFRDAKTAFSRGLVRPRLFIPPPGLDWRTISAAVRGPDVVVTSSAPPMPDQMSVSWAERDKLDTVLELARKDPGYLDRNTILVSAPTPEGLREALDYVSQHGAPDSAIDPQRQAILLA